MAADSYPLFPLKTVLFPGGLLPLRIFEARYLDMVSRCMREEVPFVISQIIEGKETGEPALSESVGVSVRIVDWESLPGGLLGVTVLAEHKVKVLNTETQADNLLIARVEQLSQEPVVPLPQDAADMAHLLERILEELPLPYTDEMKDFSSANWVSARLIELLPFADEVKQEQLEESNPLQRVTALKRMLQELDLIG